jgi:hypothetical protein
MIALPGKNHPPPIGVASTSRITSPCSGRYLVVPPAHRLRLAARAFLLVIPHVNDRVGRQCLGRAAQLVSLVGPDWSAV